MKFDFNKYDKRKFHDEPEIDKKIKALYLWFEYETLRNKWSLTKQLTMIDSWILNFEKHNMSTVSPFFIVIRRNIIKRIIRRREHRKTTTHSLMVHLRWLRRKVNKIVKHG
jgi:hypothetical protein